MRDRGKRNTKSGKPSEGGSGTESRYHWLLPVITAVFLFCLTICFLFMFSKRFNTDIQRFLKQEETKYQQIAGSIEESEIWLIADAMKGKQEQQTVSEGKERLARYGYRELSFLEKQDSVQALKRNFMLLLLCFCAVYTAACFSVFFHCRRRRRQELEQISRILQDFLKGNNSLPAETVPAEGLPGVLTHQLEQLGNGIALKSERLEREKESTKALVTDVSHQIKTPMAALRLCYELLEEEDCGVESRQKLLRESGKQLDQLERLLEELTHISQLEKSLIHLDLRPVPVKELLQQSVNAVFRRAELKKVRIDVEKVDKEAVIVDEKWTVEAIVNLLDNAVKYSPENEKIVIRVQEGLQFVKLYVTDAGPGVPRGEQAEIFGRFYRGSSELVKRTEGSGVGLYLTRKILEGEGGSIIVNSDGKHGSTFMVQLRKAEAAPGSNHWKRPYGL